jgi:AP-3 complex subunit beta
MVVGSAVAAFVEVCPNRFDLIHPHFRKICHLLADIDEWGQIVIINMLIRYGRTQFADPSKEKKPKEKKPKKEAGLKIDDDEKDDSEEDEEESEEDEEDDYVTLDPDHRLLLDSCSPLLKSRNAGVNTNS